MTLQNQYWEEEHTQYSISFAHVAYSTYFLWYNTICHVSLSYYKQNNCEYTLVSHSSHNYMATIKCLNTRAKMSIFLGQTSHLATTLANVIVMCRYVCAVEVRVPVSPVFHSEKSGHPIYKTHQYSILANYKLTEGLSSKHTSIFSNDCSTSVSLISVLNEGVALVNWAAQNSAILGEDRLYVALFHHRCVQVANKHTWVDRLGVIFVGNVARLDFQWHLGWNVNSSLGKKQIL